MEGYPLSIDADLLTDLKHNERRLLKGCYGRTITIPNK